MNNNNATRVRVTFHRGNYRDFQRFCRDIGLSVKMDVDTTNLSCTIENVEPAYVYFCLRPYANLTVEKGV